MLRVPLNKGDLYESHVAGLHPHDNFGGGQNGKMVVTCFALFLGGSEMMVFCCYT